MSKADENPLLAAALKRNWISEADAERVRVALHGNPSAPVADLLASLGLITEAQQAALLAGDVEPAAREHSLPASTDDGVPTIELTFSKPAAALRETGEFVSKEAQEEGDQPATKPATHDGRGDPSRSGPPIDTIPSDAPGRVFGNRHEIAGKPRYVLAKRLARGGLGAVWLAHDQHIDRDVAIKEMLPAAAKSTSHVRRFHEEAQVTGRLEHPGIVPIYELGQKVDGSPFYSMKLLRGHSYAAAIREFHAKKPLDPSERTMRFRALLDAFVDVCNAVGYAHDRGVLHRDLKPLNVMLGDYGEAIVVDWGLALEIGAAATKGCAPAEPGSDVGAVPPPDAKPGDLHADADRTKSATIEGTPAYMAPEQARGEISKLDARTDIYSLGVMLYEALVGKPPFSGADAYAIIGQALKGKFDPPRIVDRTIAPELDAICRKAMAHSPEDRYRSARELANEVGRWLAGEPVAAYPEPWNKRFARWARRRRAAVASALVVVVLGSMTLFGWRIQAARRISGLAETARSLLSQGRAALDVRDIDLAENRAGQVEALVSNEPGLPHDLKHRAKELARAARDSRVAGISREVRRLLSRGRESLAADDLDDAAPKFDAASALLDSESALGHSAALAKVRAEANREQASAERLRSERRERTASQTRLARFHALYDDALFHEMLYTGLGAEIDLTAASEAAGKALAIYAISIGPDGAVSIDDPYLTDPVVRRRIRDRSMELVLLRADVVTHQGLAGDPDPDAVRAALAGLAQAEKLGLTTSAYHRKRADLLDRLGEKDAAARERVLADATKTPPKPPE